MLDYVAMSTWVDRAAYPFSSRFLDVPAGRVHYVDEGRGEPVLFVHGTPSWSFEFRHLIAALQKTHRCVAPDHLGFGLSDRPAGFAYTPEAHAASLAAFVDRLGLERLHLVVHDLGGPIGLPLAGRAASVTVMNSFMWPLDDDPEVARPARLLSGRFGRFVYRWLNLSLRVLMPMAFGDRKKLTAEVHAQYLFPFRDRDAREKVLWTLARSLLSSRAHYESLWAARARLKNLTLIWGMKDRAFGPRYLERFASLGARVVRAPGAGHWPHEEEPELVTRALRESLVTSAEDRARAP
jgi:haloalkane dehalogenase